MSTPSQKFMKQSFEGDESTLMGTLLSGVKTSYIFDLLLETRKADQEFAVYKAGGKSKILVNLRFSYC